MLSQEERHEIEEELGRYPYKRAVCIDAMKIVQRHRGWVSDEALVDIAGLLEMTVDELDGVASFYNQIFRKPVGSHVIEVCDSVSCWILGYDRLRDSIAEAIGVGLGETSADGRFTFLPVVCLGACDRAPVLMVDDDLHADVDAARVGEILERYQ